MAFLKHGGRPQHPKHNPMKAPQKALDKTYTNDDLHVDIVNASFVDMRGVETGKTDTGKPLMEYMDEAEAKLRGFHETWLQAEAIDKGLKHQEETTI